MAPITSSAAPADTAALRRKAQEFEAMAIGELLKPMFDTVDAAHGPFGGGEGESAFRPMLTEAIAKQMAAHGGIGLADAIYGALLRAQEKAR